MWKNITAQKEQRKIKKKKKRENPSTKNEKRLRA